MLLHEAEVIPTGSEWIYETKYDGYRCILEWDEDNILLLSRRGNVLNANFPEILRFCQAIHEQVKSFFPLRLDGEIVFLMNNFKSNFSIVQTRGHMSNEQVITKHAHHFQCHYVAFDLLLLNGKEQINLSLEKRKENLKILFQKLEFPMSISYENNKRIQGIESFSKYEGLWEQIRTYNGEGLIAKKKKSAWLPGKRTDDWMKVKNWKFVHVLVTKYDKSNGYFTGAVYRDGMLVEVTTFLHGLKEEERKTLATLFQTKGEKLCANVWQLAPSICVQIACVDFDGKYLREPRFHAFDLQMDAESCQWQQMLRQLNPLPESVQTTHLDKPVWPEKQLQKDDYLLYLQQVFPFILPFLRDRLLTVIRYPHGVIGERFYQKNAPSSLPTFVQTFQSDDIDFIVCNELQTLLWLGNQLALEFHIPFQTVHTKYPTEIVFDLDPPSADEFSLAIEAALRMKLIFDQFNLQSFVKTSGGKGLQVYIPLPFDLFSYNDTRVFTKFVCDFLCEQEPNWFTTERLKKNRGNKLYLDYVQHHEGKTIIAPYSPRGNEQALVATPLEWDEVHQTLRPEAFSIPSVVERLRKLGDPFQTFREVRNEHPFEELVKKLKDLT